MTNSVKVALIIMGGVVAITVIAAVASVQITGGDTGALIRNLGIIAVFLITNIPTVITTIRTRQRTEVISQRQEEIADTTQKIQEQVNGTLHTSVRDGVAEGITQATAQINQDNNKQEGGEHHDG